MSRYTDGCIGCRAASEGELQCHTVWVAEIRLKMQFCLNNPLKFEVNTWIRSDDVMQLEYRWNSDLDVLIG